MFRLRKQIVLVTACICLATATAPADFNPFASKVINISLNGDNYPNYLPAPGQRVNLPFFNDPNDALGAPSGGGTSTPNNDGVVTLGGFGGQIVLAFDHDVQNNAANPMGLDAIVFTNALWHSANPQWHWGELATIEIMPELNDNNTPGDDPNEIWYLVPGSHILGKNRYRSRTWYDTDFGYPVYSGWPLQYDTAAYELDPDFQNIGTEDEQIWVLLNPNYQDGDPNNDTLEGYCGYAEYTPTLKLGDRDGDDSATGPGDSPDMPAEIFYTTPDDPMTVGMTAGSCGGDAFDISWAVEPNTWKRANLASFRYIRITTAMDEQELGYEGVLGEVSAEIDAVADVRPIGDIDGDDDIDVTDLDLLSQSWLCQWGQPEFNPAADFVVDNKIDFADYASFARGWDRCNSPAVRLEGDIDGDSDIDIIDLSLFSKSWLAQFGQQNFNPAADLAPDNRINFADYVLFASGWGSYNSQ